MLGAKEVRELKESVWQLLFFEEGTTSVEP